MRTRASRLGSGTMYRAHCENTNGEGFVIEFRSVNDAEARRQAVNMAPLDAKIYRLLCLDSPHGRLVA